MRELMRLVAAERSLVIGSLDENLFVRSVHRTFLQPRTNIFKFDEKFPAKETIRGSGSGTFRVGWRIHSASGKLFSPNSFKHNHFLRVDETRFLP